jgi:hypothetical protein
MKQLARTMPQKTKAITFLIYLNLAHEHQLHQDRCYWVIIEAMTITTTTTMMMRAGVFSFADEKLRDV